MDKSDTELQEDIRRARVFLNEYFPEDNDAQFLIKSGWHVRFPDVDKAEVVATFLGEEMPSTTARYCLTWTPTGMVWEPQGIDIRRTLGMPNMCASLPVPDA